DDQRAPGHREGVVGTGVPVFRNQPMTWDLERRDAVAVFHFNRPPDNQARLEDLRELDSLLADVSADESIALVVLASRCPGYFIAHADREEVARFRRGEPIGDTFDRWRITTL